MCPTCMVQSGGWLIQFTPHIGPAIYICNELLPQITDQKMRRTAWTCAKVPQYIAHTLSCAAAGHCCL